MRARVSPISVLAFFLVLTAFPQSSHAASPGTLGMASTTKFTFEVRRTTGSIPMRLLDPSASLLENKDWSQLSTWLQLTGGVTGKSSDTDLGTQLGVEWSLRLGAAQNEVPEFQKSVVIGFDGSVAMAFRTVSWSGPFYGAVLVLAGGELGAGGGHWWSDTARLSFFGGTRMVATQKEGNGSFEMTYLIVPFEFGGAPGDLRSRRVEHRIGLTGGIDNIGLGAWFYGVMQSVRLEGESTYVSVGGTGFGGSFELRW